MDKNKYLLMCEQLGKDPDPKEMPADFNDFPYPVQQAIIIYSILPDNWDGFGGNFLGKDYSILPYLAKEVYIIENHSQLMQYLLIINNIVSNHRAQKRKQQESKAKRKNKGKHGG